MKDGLTHLKRSKMLSILQNHQIILSYWALHQLINLLLSVRACGVCDCRTKMRMSAYLRTHKTFSFFATNKCKECDASLDFFFLIFSSKREESTLKRNDDKLYYGL